MVRTSVLISFKNALAFLNDINTISIHNLTVQCSVVQYVSRKSNQTIIPSFSDRVSVPSKKGKCHINDLNCLCRIISVV